MEQIKQFFTTFTTERAQWTEKVWKFSRINPSEFIVSDKYPNVHLIIDEENAIDGHVEDVQANNKGKLLSLYDVWNNDIQFSIELYDNEEENPLLVITSDGVFAIKENLFPRK